MMDVSNKLSFDKLVENNVLKVARGEGLKNPKIGNVVELKGEGYVGMIHPIKVTGSNGELELIVKTANKDPKVREKVPLKESFDTETYFYDVVLKKYRSLNPVVEKENLLKMFPKCFWVESGDYEEMLIMENLKEQNYEIWDKFKCFDATHTEALMKVYATFHAIGLAYKHQHPEDFALFAEGLGENYKNWMKSGMLNACLISCNSNMNYIKDVSVKNKFKKFVDSVSSFLYDYDYKQDSSAVVTHSDCWSNNMMFKYATHNGIKQLEDIKLLDFQLSQTSSFIYDVSKLLCTCTDETIWNNLNHYLELYHSTFNIIYKKITGRDAFSFETFMDEFKRKARYGLVLSSFFIRVMLISKEEAPDGEDILVDDFFPKFSKTIQLEEQVIKRHCFLIDYFCKHNLLD